MAAIAQRVASVRREKALPNGSHGARRTGRRKSRARGAFRLAAPVLALGFVFLYVALYANLTATSYSRTRIVAACRQERITNERLKVEYIRRSSPHNVMAAAQSAGMVYASRYEYLGRSERIASARGGNR